jgi:hypothetical protein
MEKGAAETSGERDYPEAKEKILLLYMNMFIF